MMTSLSSLTTAARQILSVPRQDRLALINKHPDPEALKAEIIRLHKPHKGFRVYLHSQPGSVAMIDGNGATLDEALKMAQWQFGDADVVRVVTGEEDRDDAANRDI